MARVQHLPVSVVIPAYRRPDMVERAVRSVLAQSQTPAEIIVVDDASGDETGARAASLGARVITHDENQGEGRARNTGLRAARHDWVALLDCDDEWLPNHLATVWAARGDHVLVGAAAIAVADGSDERRVYGWGGRRPLVITGPAAVAVPENNLVPSAALLRRDHALAVGGFRKLPRAADLDLWLRMTERGTAVALPTVTAIYHVHPGQVSTDQRLMDEAHRGVLDEFADRPWCSSTVLRRHEGVVAWDGARAAWADGEPRGRTALALARRLAQPQRAIGVGQLLAGRFMRRRLAARTAGDLA
jgi:glycosyltransferase involved in cell wall biosynthesis